MTSMNDLLIAVRRKLLAFPEFADLIGTDVGRDPIGQAFRDGWVFRSDNDDFRPDRNPRNSGTSTVTFGWRNPWTNPNAHNTARFPHLEFVVLSDQTRKTGDTTLTFKNDAAERCDRVATAIRNCFHDPANQSHAWPNDVFIVSCVLWNDVIIRDVPEQDGLVAGTMSFALVI